MFNRDGGRQLAAALAPMFDVDGALRFLALEMVLVNNDGYWARASDYSLYLDETGRVHVLPHDVNEGLAEEGWPRRTARRGARGRATSRGRVLSCLGGGGRRGWMRCWIRWWVSMMPASHCGPSCSRFPPSVPAISGYVRADRRAVARLEDAGAGSSDDITRSSRTPSGSIPTNSTHSMPSNRASATASESLKSFVYRRRAFRLQEKKVGMSSDAGSAWRLESWGWYSG